MKPMAIIGAMTVALCSGTLYSAEGNPKLEFLDTNVVIPKSANAPISEAVRLGNTLYISGMLAFVPGKPELAKGGIKAETAQVMNNIKAILEHHQLSMEHIVKCTVLMADMADWPTFNEVYSTFFSQSYPARTAFQAAGLGLGARVEVECMAAIEL